MEQQTYPQGIKWTKQRKCVYKILLEAREPLSAVQIYQRTAKEQEDSYAVSTIYRILAAFEEKKLIAKTNWPGDGTSVYELNRGAHTHYVVCLNCHKRIRIAECPFAHMQLEEGVKDFLITGHKLELYGYCRKCRDFHSDDK